LIGLNLQKTKTTQRKTKENTMEVLFGITGKDFVLVAADTAAARSVVVMKHNEDKSRALNDNTIMLYSGEAGDTVQFAEYIQRNVQLYSIRNNVQLSTKEAAHFTRKELAESLRSRVKKYHISISLFSFIIIIFLSFTL